MYLCYKIIYHSHTIRLHARTVLKSFSLWSKLCVMKFEVMIDKTPVFVRYNLFGDKIKKNQS